MALLGILLTTYWLGSQRFAPQLHTVGSPPTGLDARAVSIPSSSGSLLSGWLLPASGPAGIVLMHGRGGDRRSMLERAWFLQQAGYTALVFDFQANGESPGEHVTNGYLESLDARAAVRYLRSKLGSKPIGIVGYSLGGAAALLGPDGPLAVDAMVLEAVYPTIEEATANRIRLRLGPWSGWLYPLFTWQFYLRLGIASEDLRPIDRIGKVRCPLLVIAGGRDTRTTLEQSLRLFQAAPAPKRLWVVPGADHEDFYGRAPGEYRRRVLTFFRETLGTQGAR